MAKGKATTPVIDPHLDFDPLGLGETNEDGEEVVGATLGSVSLQLAEEGAEFITTRKQRSVAELQAKEVEENADPSVAAALAAMQQEIENLRGQLAQTQDAIHGGDDGGQGGYPYMYYKRPNDGGPMANWIVVANGGMSPVSGGRDTGTYSNLLSKGFKPLPRYGIVAPPSGWGGRSSVYRTMINNGGAKEFPPSQVLQLKWHMEPPVPGTVFPQYEKVKDKARTFECDEGACNVTISFMPEDQESASACLDHMRGSHGYKWDEARAALVDQGIEYRTARVRLAAAEAKSARLDRALLELDEDD
jgi:hypothetical protein